MTCLSDIENIHVFSEDRIITPKALKQQLPMTLEAVRTVAKGQNVIKDILDRKDPRLFVVVGPCSIHDIRAAREYAEKLKVLAKAVGDTLFLVMRVYFEKPRTEMGWQGLIVDPFLDGTYQIEEGLSLARQLLLSLAEMGVAASGEALDLISPQYIQDLFSWTAIGARTVESQTHRRMASGFSSAVGFKNRTDGNWQVALHAMRSAKYPSHFLSVNPEGKVAVVRTKGNPYTHLVLRGGHTGPNYDVGSIVACEDALIKAGFTPNIMVDCSHGNSAKDPAKQVNGVNAVIQQILGGNRSIVALMLESNLNWGKQSLDPKKGREGLQYGVSITDPCIDWVMTDKIIRRLHKALGTILLKRGKG
ncbi:MAG: 3-deoxy-7-phosphoheptulonate synthase [Gammaproteobacteria bacterium]|nr:3-deoxy-7-phosphoheptulonate synthase [Gammaproteobacteria bacterium]